MMWLRRLSPALVLLMVAHGCVLSRPRSTVAPPIVFTAPPQFEQIVDAINTNSSRIHQLRSDNVRLSMSGPVSLSATVAIERSSYNDGPPRFRMTGTALGTRQLDLGSNDQEFWMWIKQHRPPTVFWGRHREFYQSSTPPVLPVPPSWIVDALGIIYIDPRGDHDPVYASETSGLLQIRSRIPTPRGDLLRILEIDSQRALIVQQQLYDSSNRLLAIADTSNFVHSALSGVSLPRTIKVQLPASGMAFDFEIGSYSINQPLDASLWTMPQIPEHHYRNVADPREMHGVNMMGSQDFYDTQRYVSRPSRPEMPRAAWRRLPPFSVFR